MDDPRVPELGVPVQLSHFFLEDRRFPAVYFLFHEGLVVYVGQTKTLKFRIEGHIAEGAKQFDAVGFIPCSVGRLLALERRYIRQLAPKYNACLVAQAARRSSPWRVSTSSGMKLNVEQAAAFLSVMAEDILRWRDTGLLQKNLRSRKGRGRLACWHWTVPALNRFRDAHTDEIIAARSH
jgi:hypothetical protein